MPNTSRHIERSRFKLPPEDFFRLYKLYSDTSWLMNKSTAFDELWDITENDAQKNLLEYLIKNFLYLKSCDLESASVLVSEIVEKQWNLNPDCTIISATCDNERPDGSLPFLQSLKNAFSYDWSEDNFKPTRGKGLYNAKNGYTLILVDDFIGSGNKISKIIEECRTYFIKNGRSVVIKVISLAAMSACKEKLDTLGLEYKSIHWLEKAISHYLTGADKDNAIKEMRSLEGHLKKEIKGWGRRLSTFSFGYKKSESLFVLEASNVPNNVFPIFWWPKYKGGFIRKTMFRRAR